MSKVILLHLPTGAEHIVNIPNTPCNHITHNIVIGVLTDYITGYVCKPFDDELNNYQLNDIQSRCMTNYGIADDEYTYIISNIIAYCRNNIIYSFYSRDADCLPSDIWTKIDIDEFEFITGDCEYVNS